MEVRDALTDHVVHRHERALRAHRVLHRRRHVLHLREQDVAGDVVEVDHGDRRAFLGEPGGDADADMLAAACRARIQGFREDTRALRMRIADEAEARFARKVAWGARCGDEEELFTTLSVPVMTRLRLPERQVLDTLVDAGVARSRSHALAWCVRLVGDHEGEWIDQLREALVHVEKVRSEGPGARGGAEE